MVEIPQNDKDGKEPECFMCCGTTCDNALSIKQLRNAHASSTKYYKWYLEAEAKCEKLQVELTATKRELANATRKQGAPHTFKSPFGTDKKTT